ncbi:methyl-accepting chemotaxis protein [Agrobacterium vitis]|nr:methyl-accepting chemotaxis protein [Agrobacterium vitis]
MKFSIRTILVGSYALLSLMLSGIVGSALLNAWSDYKRYSEVAQLALLDQAFFNAMLPLRSERGAASQALLLEPNAASKTLEISMSNRKLVDGGMASAKALLDGMDTATLAQPIATVLSNYNTVIGLRQKLDQAASTAVAQRDPTLDKTWMAQSGQFVDSLDRAITEIEGRIRTLDPTMVPQIQIRSSSWNARATVGNTSLIINAALAQGSKFDEATYNRLMAYDARANALWQIVGSVIAHPSTAISVKEAYNKANSSFFTGEFAQLRDSVIADLHSGKPVTITFNDFRARNTAAQEQVATVASAAMTNLEHVAKTSKARSLQSVILYLLAFFAAAAVVLTGLLVIIFRVIRPIGSLTTCMGELASGHNDISVPGVQRSDEIGGMARSVEVFRLAAIRNHQLEIEAEEARKQAEIARIEVQRQAEEEADRRLALATGTLAQGLQRLASGDMLCEINEQFAPQFEALRHDFNQSVAQLRSVLVMVSGSTSVVSNGSLEISSASDNLAKRTEQQAASLEQTAAALEQITANVKATTKRTSEARDQVRTARDNAEQSSAVVNQAVDAMGKIEQSSKQITQIISVIDEIAFQTNLLALNAGVEAARAGEAGKGFAVVAQEVRELAQRSANAAKEIKALISNSEAAVMEGVKLVNNTGEGLTLIADLVLSINHHMDAIATSAQEQSVGLGEVNTAVNHMDQATQQNAAMVEEMSAAGTGLAHESQKLTDLLARFKTGASAAAGHRDTMRDGGALKKPVAASAQASRPMARGGSALATKTQTWEDF